MEKKGGGGQGEGREKVGRGEQGGESTEAKERRESKKEKRKKKGERRTVRLLRTEMPLALCRTGRTPPSRCPEEPGEVLLPRAPPPGPQGCLSAGCRSPTNSSWQREEARQVSAVPSVPQLIIYLFVFNKKLTFSVKPCTGKITIVFQVESPYYRWVLEAVIKIFLDVKVPPGLAWVGSPKMGAALPRGQGRTEPGGGEGGGSAEVRGNPRLLGHRRAARSRGMSPGEETFARMRARPNTPQTS